uniref:RAMP superfamily protein n=1 Tax=Candidatus Scalindua brodae TaxID=237368 RepID=UPI002549C1E7|nr:Chain B, RAMP superfamily protein [Candidatus Scalindua brodae]
MNITVELTFFEPYRLVEWFDWDARKKSHSAMRGQAFAQWTWKGKGRTAGKSFITGTLVRSAVIKAVEELLSLNNGKWEGVPCCNGSFQTDESKGKKPSFLRKRHTLQWQANNKNICDKEEACPFCILLGRFDNAGKVHERNKDYDIHFSNFDLDHKQEKNDLRLVDIASGRILNRVDFDTGKAKDYFRTWEADYETYGTYTGRITLRNEHAKKLLLASLGFVDKLCGALCRIEVIKDHNDELRKQAEVIVEAFKQNDKLEKIRILADAIRTLRLHGEGVIEKDELPDGKEERDKGHHLWDIKVQGTALRTKLKELWQSNKDIGWRKFTEMLGSNLYLIYKKETGGVSTEYYSKAHDSEGSDLFIPVTPPEGIETKEWIIVGRLKAATPFYFGVQQPSDSIPGKEINEHTSFNILLDKENRYRIPRSALRGALRRDLRTAFGSGCNVSLGGQILCNCKVCIEMRRITLKDSVSDFSEPPEIRYRIAKNPGTATVEDGSLFDIEVGPEGLTFPFVLRYRGHKFPEQLSSVIRYWEENDGKNGMAWLGGLDSTGKGRFALKDIKIFEWDLNQKINEYIKERGMRGKEKELLEMGESSLPDGLIPYKFFEERECLFPYKENLKPQWSEVQYTIEVGSPLLTADTISALTEPGNRDAIAYKKRVYNDGNNAIEPEPRFAVKSETHRGIFRTAVGRRTGDLGKEDHEDCTCDMCIIFGNEHESSKIRFEDLELINGNEFEKLEKHIDHVAIDRFTGGALDKAKFDTYPLAGSPKKPLKLKGRFWIKKGFSGDHKLLITTALSDIRDGLYPLGSKGGVGYGWVAGISIDDNVPDDFKEMINKTNNDYVHPGHQSPKQDHKNKNIYYPHYFLDSGSKVYREKDIITHEEFTEELLSGKINCKLETLTPLIIPDTSDENGLKLQGNKPGHKNYKFFNINGELMIPGSELRGMLRTHFEALTKSCFAIFGEDSTLSWASKTLGGKLDKALHPCTGLSDGLCPGCHLFGTTDYKGRVKFGFAKYENGPEWLITRGNNPERSLTLGVLESPRPAFSIPDDESEIPGRKFYLHHNGWRIIRQKQLEIRETVQPERNVTTEVMDKGNVFSFDVRFENLREWELGLLLQSLDPGKNIAHKLGKGKPYGFGSVKIKIDSLHTFKINSNNDKIKRVPQSDIREYINKGYQKLIEWSGNNSIQKGNVLPQWHVIPHIDKLYKLLWVPFLNDSKLEPDVRYPVLNEESKGYIEGSDYTYKKLGDKDNLPYKTRVKGLTTPWSPWNPFQV